MTAPFSEAVFLAVAALATIALYASYAVPIALGVVARVGKRWTRMGPFTVRRAGVPIAVVAVAWTAIVFVVCALANALAMGLFAGVLAVLGGALGPEREGALQGAEGRSRPLRGHRGRPVQPALSAFRDPRVEGRLP